MKNFDANQNHPKIILPPFPCLRWSRALDGGSGRVRLTKSQKVSAKNCGQIVANRVRASVLQLDDVFAIAGFGLLFDALLPFGPPARRGRIPRWSPLVAAVSQLWADLGRF